MASPRQQRLAVVVAVLALAFLAFASLASAARPAPAAAASSGGREEAAAASSSYLQMYPVVKKARETVEMLMARLPAGPSPKGPGH